MLTLTRLFTPLPSFNKAMLQQRSGQNSTTTEPTDGFRSFSSRATTVTNQVKIEENTPALSYQANRFFEEVTQAIPNTGNQKTIAFIHTLVPELESYPAVQQAILANKPAQYIQALLGAFKAVGTAITEATPLENIDSSLHPVVERLRNTRPEDFKYTHELKQDVALKQGLILTTALLDGTQNTQGLSTSVKDFLIDKHAQLKAFKPYKQKQYPPLLDMAFLNKAMPLQVSLLREFLEEQNHAESNPPFGSSTPKLAISQETLHPIAENATFIERPQSDAEIVQNLGVFLQRLDTVFGAKPGKFQSALTKTYEASRASILESFQKATDDDLPMIIMTWYNRFIKSTIEQRLEKSGSPEEITAYKRDIRTAEETPGGIKQLFWSGPLESMLHTISDPEEPQWMKLIVVEAVKDCSEILKTFNTNSIIKWLVL